MTANEYYQEASRSKARDFYGTKSLPENWQKAISRCVQAEVEKQTEKFINGVLNGFDQYMKNNPIEINIK